MNCVFCIISYSENIIEYEFYRNKDYYHTCYALSGLSVSQHFASGRIGKIKVVGPSENVVVSNAFLIYFVSF